jgi:hypothetical protein
LPLPDRNRNVVAAEPRGLVSSRWAPRTVTTYGAARISGQRSGPRARLASSLRRITLVDARRTIPLRAYLPPFN